jgi:methyltransferase
MFDLLLLATAFVPMLAEAAIAARHDRALRARGATEPAADVYGAMQVAYPVCFLVMVGEAWLREAGVDGMFVAGVVVFAAAKALKYWAIATLGERWTFRVLVPPGSALVREGPYRWIRHPNYVAVAGELAGFAVMTQAAVTGVAGLIVFVLLMLARVRIEEQALGIRE